MSKSALRQGIPWIFCLGEKFINVNLRNKGLSTVDNILSLPD